MPVNFTRACPGMRLCHQYTHSAKTRHGMPGVPGHQLQVPVEEPGRTAGHPPPAQGSNPGWTRDQTQHQLMHQKPVTRRDKHFMEPVAAAACKPPQPSSLHTYCYITLAAGTSAAGQNVKYRTCITNMATTSHVAAVPAVAAANACTLVPLQLLTFAPPVSSPQQKLQVDLGTPCPC